MTAPDPFVLYLPLPQCTVTATNTTTTPRYLCPDLLSIRDIGDADGWRGHLVRAFFRVLKAVTGV